MRNPQMGNIPNDPRTPRPPEDDSIVVIDEDTPMDSATAYQANPVNRAMRKAQVLHEKKMEDTPNFKSLGELKTIFSSNLIVRIYLDDDDEDAYTDFRIRKCSPTDLLIMQRSLISLSSSIFGKDNELFNQDEPPDDETLLENLSVTQMDELLELTQRSQTQKHQLIINHVLEPEIDLELVQNLPQDVIDTLYNAIAGHIQGGQEFLTTFRGDGEQPEQ